MKCLNKRKKIWNYPAGFEVKCTEGAVLSGMSQNIENEVMRIAQSLGILPTKKPVGTTITAKLETINSSTSQDGSNALPFILSAGQVLDPQTGLVGTVSTTSETLITSTTTSSVIMTTSSTTEPTTTTKFETTTTTTTATSTSSTTTSTTTTTPTTSTPPPPPPTTTTKTTKTTATTTTTTTTSSSTRALAIFGIKTVNYQNLIDPTMQSALDETTEILAIDDSPTSTTIIDRTVFDTTTESTYNPDSTVEQFDGTLTTTMTTITTAEPSYDMVAVDNDMVQSRMSAFGASFVHEHSESHDSDDIDDPPVKELSRWQKKQLWKREKRKGKKGLGERARPYNQPLQINLQSDASLLQGVYAPPIPGQSKPNRYYSGTTSFHASNRPNHYTQSYSASGGHRPPPPNRPYNSQQSHQPSQMTSCGSVKEKFQLDPLISGTITKYFFRQHFSVIEDHLRAFYIMHSYQSSMLPRALYTDLPSSYEITCSTGLLSISSKEDLVR